MVAFAANSLLCRGALGFDRIDAVSFTTARLVSGAVALLLMARWQGSAALANGSWPSAAALVGYAIAFSFAYTRIPTGVGALLLFGAVQVTMLGRAVATGVSLRPGEWLGLVLALGGLVVLTRPGLEAPDPAGATLMVVAGAAWGVYTLRGRGQPDPLGATAGNFALAALPALALSAMSAPITGVHWTPAGVTLAVVSGVFASGLGYVMWYAALRGLAPAVAAIVQLSAPLLAAIGGVALLREAVTVRLGVATVLVLGGVALAILTRQETRP
jgi:drug/metabolite transporter (DMT)-like permease